MTEYLVLLKLDRGKLLETMNNLRDLPRKPISGIELQYTMNVLGTWDVAVWFSSDKSSDALDFISNKIGKIQGVVDAFPVATFPHIGSTKENKEESA